VSRLAATVRAVWQFVVGDDWRIALGVVAGLGLTAALQDGGVPAWWVLPIAVVALLGGSLSLAVRDR
jgi:hypothetical protein